MHDPDRALIAVSSLQSCVWRADDAGTTWLMRRTDQAADLLRQARLPFLFDQFPRSVSAWVDSDEDLEALQHAVAVYADVRQRQLDALQDLLRDRPGNTHASARSPGLRRR